jgi:hypothetical protein
MFPYGESILRDGLKISCAHNGDASQTPRPEQRNKLKAFTDRNSSKLFHCRKHPTSNASSLCILDANKSHEAEQKPKGEKLAGNGYTTTE